tara:strand:+ start:1369 stop:1545 length:177 start_codon:yes stop_codon:yes gene_type:complete
MQDKLLILALVVFIIVMVLGYKVLKKQSVQVYDDRSISTKAKANRARAKRKKKSKLNK